MLHNLLYNHYCMYCISDGDMRAEVTPSLEFNLFIENAPLLVFYSLRKKYKKKLAGSYNNVSISDMCFLDKQPR